MRWSPAWRAPKPVASQRGIPRLGSLAPTRWRSCARAAAAQLILGKPGSAANCIDQLHRCSGKSLAFITAVAIVRHLDDTSQQFIDTTRVTFRVLDVPTIERYVALESPLDCAGGFKSEGLGIAFCESIDSMDPSALIGLPLIRLCEVLRSLGYTLP